MPKSHTEMDLITFQGTFSTDEACRERLFNLRWPDGFRCPRCGGKIIYSEFYQNARDYTIRKDGKVPKRYVSRSGELSESVAACENGCGVYWEDEDFSIGQDGMFYDNKYTEDGQA